MIISNLSNLKIKLSNISEKVCPFLTVNISSFRFVIELSIGVVAINVGASFFDTLKVSLFWISSTLGSEKMMFFF